MKDIVEIDFLIDYMQVLEERYSVSVTFTDALGVFRKNPAVWNILANKIHHNNPFCNAVKQDKACFDACLTSKFLCSETCRKTHMPFGNYCHMGVCEYVFPVVHNNILLAFISVGPFTEDMDELAKRIEASAYTDKARLHRLCADFAQAVPMEKSFQMDFTALAALLAYALSVSVSEDAAEQFENEIVNTAVNFILLNFNEKLSLDSIAKHCKCNKNYLCTRFRAVTGKSMWDYINKIRINRAVSIMHVRKLSIANVAMECGFESPAYFSTVFKKYMHCTPKAYKQNILKESAE